MNQLRQYSDKLKIFACNLGVRIIRSDAISCYVILFTLKVTVTRGATNMTLFLQIKYLNTIFHFEMLFFPFLSRVFSCTYYKLDIVDPKITL